MTNNLASPIFLILAACIAIAYAAVRLFGPGRYTPWERVLYAPVYALARVLWRVEIEWIGELGGESPKNAREARDRLLGERMTGGAVLVANHRCSVDPFFVQLIGGRRVHWMVAGEYFKHFLFGPVLRTFQAIPTNRGGVDTASTKRAIALAKRGRFVGMFPEGRINRTESPLLTIRPGAAIVALRASVPLVPIWIEGAPAGWAVYSALFIPARVRIIVGAPDRFETKVQELVTATNTEIDENPELEHREPENASYDRSQARSDAVAWVSRVMGKSLTMGGHSPDEVAIAGRKWLDT
jgi:1-acyl-sn-glycerol-3-phosphate acyltransferase